jgi:hypothetical protein
VVGGVGTGGAGGMVAGPKFDPEHTKLEGKSQQEQAWLKAVPAPHCM